MSWRALTWSRDLVGLDSKQKAVFRALADHADENTLECFPQIDRLAIDTALSEKSVRRALDDLDEMKLIVRWHRYRNNGTRAGYHYRVVIDGELPEGVTLHNGGMPENKRPVTLTSLKKTKASPSGDQGHTVPSQGHPVPNQGLGDRAISFTEAPYEAPHRQTASSKQSDDDVFSQVANQIRERWPNDALRGSGLNQLSALVAEAAKKTDRAPDKILAAAKAYLRSTANSGRAVTWLGEWFKREEYLAHMPKLSADERRRADDATYEAALRCWLDGGEWPEHELGPPPNRHGWVPLRPLEAVLYTAPESPRLNGLGNWRMMVADYFDLRQELHGWDYDFCRLRLDGEWKGHREDPRTQDARYPVYLYQRHGIQTPRKTDLRVVA